MTDHEFQHMCYRSLEELRHDTQTVAKMAGTLSHLGYSDIAKDTLLAFLDIKKMFDELDAKVELLRSAWGAVEAYCAGQIDEQDDEQDMEKVMAAYRATQALRESEDGDRDPTGLGGGSGVM